MDDISTDLDAVKKELKFELIVLHSEVMALNKGWDFTRIIDPLLADQGPSLFLVPRIKNQIERKKKLKESFDQSESKGVLV